MAERDLRPATREEVEQSLSFALRFDGRKRIHRADLYMADLTAEHLAKHLDDAGYVVMKRPTALGHGSKPSERE